MPRVLLLDRDRHEHAPAAGFVGPYALDSWDAGLLELVPDEGALQVVQVVGVVVWRLARQYAQVDGIAAVVDRLDVDYWLRALGRGVVASPFSERTLLAALVRRDLALDYQLRVGRHRQIREFGFHALHGLAGYTAGEVVLADAFRQRDARQHQEQRVLPQADRNRTSLSAIPVFAHDHVAVTAAGDH